MKNQDILRDGLYIGENIGQFLAAANTICRGYCHWSIATHKDGLCVGIKYLHVENENWPLFWSWKEVGALVNDLDKLTEQLHGVLSQVIEP